MDNERLGTILKHSLITEPGEQKLDSEAAREFLEKELLPLWPSWKPSQPELEIWQSWLCNYDRQQAKEKLQHYYSRLGGKVSRPNAKDMFQPDNTDSARFRQIEAEIFIKCIKHDQKPRYVGLRRSIYILCKTRSRDDGRGKMDDLCKTYHQLYGGIWIVEQRSEQRTAYSG